MFSKFRAGLLASIKPHVCYYAVNVLRNSEIMTTHAFDRLSLFCHLPKKNLNMLLLTQYKYSSILHSVTANIVIRLLNKL